MRAADAARGLPCCIRVAAAATTNADMSGGDWDHDRAPGRGPPRNSPCRSGALRLLVADGCLLPARQAVFFGVQVPGPRRSPASSRAGFDVGSRGIRAEGCKVAMKSTVCASDQFS